MGRYGLADEERARLDAAPWPHRYEVARQLGAEREERAAEERAAEDKRRDEEGLAWATWTRARAGQETRNHAAGQQCDTRYCRYGH